MKNIVLLSFLFLSLSALAQPKPTDLDKSPMDMSYWPANYPILKMSGKAKDQPIARIIYGRPQKNGRTIFGGIIKYNEIWRMGANEATEIEIFRNIKVAGKTISKGRYTIFVCLSKPSGPLFSVRIIFAGAVFLTTIKKTCCARILI